MHFQNIFSIRFTRYLRLKSSQIRGWRVSVVYGVYGTAFALFANILLLVWASSRSHKSLENGIITLFNGSCNNSKFIFTASHILINCLSTILLAASNVGMQCLLAPTREEVDKAHGKGTWLHVGVLSLKNVAGIPLPRVILSAILALSSMPLHFLYNSVIFTSSSANNYNAALVSEPFLSGAYWYDPSVVPALYTNDLDFATQNNAQGTELEWLGVLQNSSSTLTHLDQKTCFKTFQNPYVSAYGNFLMVSNISIGNNPVMDDMQHRVTAGEDMYWTCSATSKNGIQAPDFGFALPNPTPKCEYNNQVFVWSLNIAESTDWAPVDYCVAQSTPQQCKVLLSLSFLAVVILINILKLTCFLVLLCTRRWQPLITLGDCISSFLNQPDGTTMNVPVLSSADVRRGLWRLSRHHSIDIWEWYAHNGFYLRPARKHWLCASSIFSWVFTLSCCCVLWVTACVLLLTEKDKNGSDMNWSSFGEIESGYLFSQGYYFKNMNLLANVLLANLPQFLVSTIYVSYSSMITCMLVCHEFGRFCQERKGLRVSGPRRSQRSTPWLSVPYRYGLPLLAIMAVLHWTMSESIFLARIDIYSGDVNHTLSASENVNTICWSPPAVIVSLIVGGMLILMLPILGLKRFPQGVPVVSTCSVAISSACHRSTFDDEDLDEKPVRFGKLPDIGQDGKNRFGFSAREVEPLVPHSEVEYKGFQSLRKRLNFSLPKSQRVRKVIPTSLAVFVGGGSVAVSG